ncbi:hypothetical protein [Marinimicrobium alkaliphilum]|uniref:hypothetical protein n=1 Tax=Marinimicrobium alkaliphilum TaxID=2202654 RepID=UPI000DBA08B0|nr:hypothetical protein [Marinimicrobium alkaliphilum]
MKPTKTKHQLRQELNQQLDAFLRSGGSINEVQRGLSGRVDNQPLKEVFPPRSEPEPRTLVNEIVAAIEARRKPKPPLTAKGQGHGQRRREPRKKLIMDDFGQPLRWEWRDD